MCVVCLFCMVLGEDIFLGLLFYIIKFVVDVFVDCVVLSGFWEGWWFFFGWGSVWVWVLEVDVWC